MSRGSGDAYRKKLLLDELYFEINDYVKIEQKRISFKCICHTERDPVQVVGNRSSMV
jgi:hypothetical protein